MSVRMIFKIIMLVLMTISAVVAVFGGYIFFGKKKNPNDAIRNRKIMRLRMICFLLMLVFLCICILI